MLGLALLHPEKTWTTPELARRLDATAISVHRELHRALDAGLVEREPIGRTYLYRGATDSPLYEPLRLLLERTVGVEPELRRAFEKIPGVEVALIHGSFAKNAAIRPTSDVDVLVLGTADPHALRRGMRELESQLGREIDVLAYTRDEFDAMVEAGNSFALGIVRGPVKPIIGALDALPAL